MHAFTLYHQPEGGPGGIYPSTSCTLIKFIYSTNFYFRILLILLSRPSDRFCLRRHMNELAASPLASSGFAAIGCFRASPYGGIYILKNYSKLTAKKSVNSFFENPNFFAKNLPLTKTELTKKNFSNRSIRSEGDRFQTYIQRYIHRS